MDVAIQILMTTNGEAGDSIGSYRPGDCLMQFPASQVGVGGEDGYKPMQQVPSGRFAWLFVSDYVWKADIAESTGFTDAEFPRRWYIRLNSLSGEERDLLNTERYLNLSWDRFSRICYRKDGETPLADQYVYRGLYGDE